MKPTGTIDYETLAQDAMRGVIVKILKTTEQSGLPGEHHFYISFDTNAPGVNISKRLRQQYPDVMTIVLQHRFWDLSVGDDQFEVKLTFDSIPERLVIPYEAIKVFFDPSVRYALQFDAPDIDGTGDARAGSAIAPAPTERSLTPVAPRPVAQFDRASATGPALVPIGALS
ncbi:MAG: ClpXP protease specificity-enhancing factor SspB, partial [Pseudomonadota bacterium]